MDEVTVKLQELINAMKKSEDYQRYRELEAKLSDDPDMRARIDQYRQRVFDMQQADRDLFEETDYVLHEFNTLLTDQTASDFLDAEGAVCRMIQRVVDAINREVDVKIPRV
uniref:YlbF family regulator n=1 Tax=Eubacterium cellulosolvens TaxID=29322 RepID=UPI00047FBF20|nr:YlbF family regulator [[Eubacterium] cellulosolvens]